MILYTDAFKNLIKYEKDAETKKKLENNYKKCITTYQKNFSKVMKEAAIGNISEIYDSEEPYLPKGTIAQAWSVSEVLKIMLEKV